jgi:hypothetical protein
VKYGFLVEFNVEPATAKIGCLGWDITVAARMLQKGFTMQMKPSIIFGQQLAIPEDRMLMTIDKSYYLVDAICTFREQE